MSSANQRRRKREERGITDDNDPRKFYQGDGYIRIAVYPVDQIIPKIGRNKIWSDKGFDLKLGSQRLLTFKRSQTCSNCGIVGEFFALEKHKFQQSDRPHLNLYAIDKNGYEILMTKDHIIPRSLGGSNRLTNLQTMCHACNVQKADIIQL